MPSSKRHFLILFFLVLSCSETSRERTPKQLTSHQPPRTIEHMRDTSRGVLEEHCGACHLPGLPTTIPDALSVFDLSTPDWAATMTDAQLEDARQRLADDIAPDGTPLAVPATDRRAFGEYVDAELAARRESRSLMTLEDPSPAALPNQDPPM